MSAPGLTAADAALLRDVRETMQVGMMDARRALDLWETGGFEDAVVASRYVYSMGLAICHRGTETDVHLWRLNWARGMADTDAARDPAVAALRDRTARPVTDPEAIPFKA